MFEYKRSAGSAAIKKLTILLASCILTVPIVAAAAPEVETKPKVVVVVDIDAMDAACRQGYAEFRYGKVPAQEALNKALAKFPEGQRGAVTLICHGYGQGYEDGKKGVS